MRKEERKEEDIDETQAKSLLERAIFSVQHTIDVGIGIL